MAFSDLISRPITAPLEGLDKSIATGVELANNQYRTQIAMEQNQLEREKLQASYLDKANAMLPSLLKSKGKARSILMNQYINFSAKGGSPVNADSLDVMLSQSTEDLDAAYQNILNSVGGDRQRAALVFRQKFGEDASEAATFIEKSAIQEQALRAASERAGAQATRLRTQFEEAQTIKGLKDISKELSKTVGDTQKEVDTILRNTSAVEAAIKQNSLANFDKTLGQQAKTSGTVGALSDYETRLQAPQGLAARLASAKKFVTGEAGIPEQVKKQVQDQISAMKSSASSIASNKFIGIISDKILDPQARTAHLIEQDRDGNLRVGFGAARLISAMNKTNRALKQDKQTLDLAGFLKKQAAPMTTEQILKFIKDAATGNLLQKDPKTGSVSPSGIKYIIQIPPESVISAPQYRDISGQEPYFLSQEEEGEE